MTNTNMDVFENEKKDALRFLSVLARHWRAIAGCIIASISIAVVITWVMPPQYRSYGVLFPTSNHQDYSPSGYTQPGFDVDVDRLLQVIDSRTMRDSLVTLLNLADHYNVNTNERTWRDEVDQALRNDLSFQQSKYLSVVVLAQMEDPELAAKTVNTVIDLSGPLWEQVMGRFDSRGMAEAERLYLEKGAQITLLSDSIDRVQASVTNDQLETLKTNWKQLERELADVHQQLKVLRKKHGFYDLEEDWQLLTEAIIELETAIQMADAGMTALVDEEASGMVDAGQRSGALKEQLRALRQKEQSLKAAFEQFPSLESRQLVLEGLVEDSRAKYLSHLNKKVQGNEEIRLKHLLDLYQSEFSAYNSLKNNFEELRFRFQKPVPPLYVVDRAVPSYKKTGPSLINNGLMGALLGFAVALLWIYVRSRFTKVETT